MTIKKVRSSAPETSIFDTLTIENRRHISQELFEKLRDAIISHEIPEGYVFPNENELCQKLNIGRGSLREAYAPLETLHLITRTKSGTYVNSTNEIQNIMNLEALAQYSNEESLSEFRNIVELGIVKIATVKATQQHIRHLDQILDSMRNSERDPAKFSQLDFDFHSAIVKITGNQLLEITFNTIRSIYEDYTESVFATGYYNSSIIEHENIVRAIESGDPEQASRMMNLHLNHVVDLAFITPDSHENA